MGGLDSARSPRARGRTGHQRQHLKFTLLDLMRAPDGNSARTISNCRRLVWCTAIATGGLQAWAFRHNLRSDGISYLDIASECAKGNWNSLVNAYWSPLYPFLLSLVFRLVRPSPYWESTVAHFVNFGVFIFSFACFEIFLKELIRSLREISDSTTDAEAMPEWALWLLGDSLFVWITLLLIHLERLQPDLCVAALVYLAAAMLLRIWKGKSRWLTYAGFGAVLGVGYLAKAVMFPLAFIFLGCGLLAAKPLRRALAGTALALAVFFLVAGPFVSSLSREKGRITFGDAGKINYAEFVDGVTRYLHWQGGPPGTGMPIHPTRILRAVPPVFEFSAPIIGTYPPWYDQSYWYEGVVPKFSLRNQLRATRYTIEEYIGILPYMGGVFVGYLGLAIFARAHGQSWRKMTSYWPIWAPAVFALGVYALVYVEARFVVPFFVLIWMALFAGLRFPQSKEVKVLVASLALATALMLCTGTTWLAGRALFRALQPQPFVDWEVAQGLERFGIRSGDKVGSIGNALEGYWAHLAGVRIVVEVPLWGSLGFYVSDAQTQSEVLADFAKTGAKIVVSDQRPPIESYRGWQEIGTTGYFVHALGTGPIVTGKPESR
jgi:hypothetical protein